MTILSASVLFIGLILFFWSEITAAATHLKITSGKILNQGFLQKLKIPKRKVRLKRLVKHLEYGKQVNFIQQSYITMSSILVQTGEKGKLGRMRAVSAISGGVGVAIALYLKSFLLLPILGVGLALIPMWLIKFKAYRYNLRMLNELSVVLSMVTNSYIRNENIVKSISENLRFMNEPVKSIFSSFVHTATFVNPDIVLNIRQLKSKIDSKVFHLWCDNLIMCQSDINQKYSLNAVVEQFTSDKELYNLLSAEVSKPMLGLFIIVAGTATAFPLTALIGRQFQVNNIFEILFSTFMGQAIIVGYVFSVLYAINIAIDLSTQIE